MGRSLTIAPGWSDLDFFRGVQRLGEQLEVSTSRLPELGLEGPARARAAGIGEDFLQSRPYQSGDPTRWIDWNATARSGEIITKQFEASKEIDLTIVIDRSASMCIGSVAAGPPPEGWFPPRTKYSAAVQIAGAIAIAALRAPLPVGVSAPGLPTVWVPPSRSPERVFAWLSQLRHYRTDQAIELGHALIRAGRRGVGIIVVITDLHDPTVLPKLRELSRTHDCRLACLTDPVDREGIDFGLVRAGEAETGRRFSVAGRIRLVDQTNAEQALTRLGCPYVVCDAAAPSAALLKFFLEQASRGRSER
jgi:uncharacterized protein (DUF58 family)